MRASGRAERAAPKIIALVDANNFFVSCERACNPALDGRPVVVLSNNDGNVIARSEEAKQAGVKMGEVFYQNRVRYDREGIVYLSSNYAIYQAKSQQVIELLGRFTGRLEYYSVDEAWLDLTETDFRALGFSSVTDYCRHIQRMIWGEARIPVSFGIGRNKTQAKLAARMAKKQPKTGGIFNIIDHPLTDVILERTKVSDLWGVNRGTTRRLGVLGIETAKQLRDAEVIFVRRLTNVNIAKIVHELRGRFCFDLEEQPKIPKMITASLSFAYEVTAKKEILEAAATYIARAAARMRGRHMVARQILVILNTNRYSKTQPHSVDYGEAALPRHSAYTPDFIETAHEIVRRCFKPGKAYHKVTVILHDLAPADAVQTSLFDQRDHDELAVMMGLADTLNETYGEGAFRFEGEAAKQPWRVRREYLSGATLESMNLKRPNPRLVPICRLGTDTALIEGLS